MINNEIFISAQSLLLSLFKETGEHVDSVFKKPRVLVRAESQVLQQKRILLVSLVYSVIELVEDEGSIGGADEV